MHSRTTLFRHQFWIRLRLLVSALLVLQLLGAYPNPISSPSTASANTPSDPPVACSTSGGAQNTLKVVPSHGKAFYIDTGITPKLDAGYVGYRVTNESSTARTGLWVELTNFTGGKISLANPDDKYFQLDSLGVSGSATAVSTAYILLKATGGTTLAQRHDVKIWDKRPDLVGANLLYACRYTFSAVKETIKASANKVEDGGTSNNDYDNNSTAIDVSSLSPKLGETFTIQVEGVTGQIGAGGVPDYDIIWFTPAAVSSWPTRAFRLVKVSAVFSSNTSNWTPGTPFSDQLVITSANGAAVDTSRYVVTYTFRVIGIPPGTVQMVPVAQIASGTQMKHTVVDSTLLDAGRLTFAAPQISYSITKEVETTTALATRTVDGVTQVAVPYKITVTSTSATPGSIEEIVDIPSTAAEFKTGSARIIDVSRTSSTAIADPIYVSSEASLSPRPLHFVGPFSASSSRSAILRYEMWLPSTANTYSNQAYTLIGDLKIGATTSAIPQVSVTTSGTNSISAATTNVTLDPEVTTVAASSVDTNTATLNGTIDANGQGGIAYFHYGTSPSLASYESVTATTPSGGTLSGDTPTVVARSLTGLSPNTTYYFRALTGTIYGDILSFTTSAVTANPSVTTNNASSVGSTTATLNSSINPNNTPVIRVEFVYKLSATEITATADVLSGGTVVTATDFGGTAAEPALSGSSVQEVPHSLTGLSTGTYYFYVRACTTLSGTSCGTSFSGAVKSFTTGKTAQSITFAEITSKTYGGAAFTVTPTAPGGTVTLTSLTPTICSVASNSPSAGYSISVLAVGECQLEANQSGDATYNPAPTVINIFQVTPTTLTLTAQDKSKVYSGVNSDNPSNSFVLSGLVGSDTATATAPTYSFSGKSGTVYASSTTAPTNVGSYDITPSGSSFTFGDPSDASNYEITYAAGTLTILRKNLTVRADDKTVAEGDAVSAFTASVTGFVLSDSGTVSSFSRAFSSATYPSSSETPTTEGVYTITPSAATITFSSGTSSNYQYVYETGTFTITQGNKATQTISLADSSVVYNNTLYLPSLFTTPDTGTGTVSYTSSDSAKCALSGTNGETLTALSGTGSCVITVLKAADATFNSATDTATITLLKANRTLSFTPETTTSRIYGETRTVSALPDFGSGAITYSLTTSTTCSLNVATLTATAVGVGGCVVSATIAADDNYISVNSSNNYTMTVTVKQLTIKADNKTIQVGAQTPVFTSTVLGLAFSETATVTAGTYSFKSGAGAYTTNEPDTSTAGVYDLKVDTATVSFGGSASNYSATYLYETGTYTISSLTSQTIVLDNSSLAYNASITLTTLLSNVGAGSGVVSYTTDDASKCSLSGANNVTLTAASGTGSCVITATKVADATYASATDTATITLSKINQTITFNTPSNMTVGGGTQSVSPTTTSSLTITITSTTLTFCTISGGVVTAVAAGTCSLTAAQGGNDNYNPASNQVVTFTITATTTNNNNNGGSSGGGGTAPAPKLKPTITWKDPSPIENETPLGNTQLNAICSVPGTLVYLPAAGTVLPPGTHTLTVTCIPLDSVTYEPVSTTVKITVIAPPPNAISHRIIFPTGGACMSSLAINSFERFLARVKALSTSEFDTQIYLSGGFFNEDLEAPMTEEAKARYQCLCDSLLKNGVSGQIFTGIFSGPRNSVEVIISWVRK